jgi:hypothetical protein
MPEPGMAVARVRESSEPEQRLASGLGQRRQRLIGLLKTTRVRSTLGPVFRAELGRIAGGS